MQTDKLNQIKTDLQMKAITLQKFRLEQIIMKSMTDANYLKLDGTHFISLNGSGVEITEISLNKDIVVCCLYDSEVEFYMPISVFADDVVEDIVEVMREYIKRYAETKVIAGVIADENGEVTKESWRI